MSTSVSRRSFTVGALAMAAVPGGARAQQQGRVPRVAYLAPTAAGDFRSQAILAGLRELGYRDGETIALQYFLTASTDDLPRLAAQAVAVKPDLIIAIGIPAVVAARAATVTLPIIFGPINDPIASGVVASLGRPGGNATGPSSMQGDLVGKRLQFLKEIFPGLVRLAIMYEKGNAPGALPSLSELQAAGRVLGLNMPVMAAIGRDDLAPLIRSAASEGTQAVYVIGGRLMLDNAAVLTDVLLRAHLASVHDQRAYVQAGCLLSYGPDLYASYKRTAYYVDRVLKGARPADLPVEQPREFEFAVNLKTARALGLTIPERLMVFATDVIE